MHQAAVSVGFALDALALQQDGLAPAEIDISWRQVAKALVVAPGLILFDKSSLIGLKLFVDGQAMLA